MEMYPYIVCYQALLFNEKTPSYWYRDSYYKLGTVFRRSWVYDLDFYTHMAVSL